MKQKLLNSIRLRAMMLVAVMCAAFAGQAWADTAGYTPSAALSSTTGSVTGTAGESWSYSITFDNAGYYGYAASYGWQLGAGQKDKKDRGCRAFSISTSDITGVITKIEVEAGSYNGNSKINVTVGGADFGTQNQSTYSGQGASKSTFTGSASGEIIISATDAVRAFYLKSITVTYTPGGGGSASIVPDETNINAPYAAVDDGTIGVTYTGVDPTDGVEIVYYTTSSADVETERPDWILIDFDASYNLEYVIDANDGAARTAYVKIYGLDGEADDVFSNLITITQAAGLDAPSFSPAAGKVDAGTTITLTQAAADEIRYTTDGTDPTKTTGNVYSTPIEITTATTIKAIAVKGDGVSAVASASYTISVATPECNLASSGYYMAGTGLTLTSTGNTIYYNMTTNGSDPEAPTSTTSTEYAGPISLSSGTVKIKAIAYDAYDNASSVVSRTINGVNPTTLPFNWAGGGKDALTALTGVVGSGLGSDYGDSHNPYMVKFDNDNDYIEVFTNAQPMKVSVGVKMIGGNSTSKIKVQESTNGVEFSDVEELTISGSQNDVVELETTEFFASTTRVIKLLFVKGSNVGVGPISITKYTVDPDIDVDPSVELTYDATSGEIEYSIVNPDGVSSLEASSTTDWISDVTVDSGNSKVTFTTTTNSGAEREGSITLTYGEVVKNVAVIQAEHPVTLTYNPTTTITSGKHYIITDGSTTAMGGQNTNNRGAITVTKDGDDVTFLSTAGVAEFVIYGPDADGYYTIYDGTGYLYAASSSNNYLRTQAGIDDNARWKITFDGEDVASIVAVNSKNRNVMQFNSTLFSCYATASQDDIYLYEKAGEATPTESVTVTAAGYATYVSDNALDFSESSINAYIAIADGTTGVTFSQITKVPANTGVLLYKDGGATEDIPTLTGAKDATTGNVFLRGTGAAVASVDGNLHNYILNKPIERPIGFYKAAGQTVAKNRAYIQIDESTPVKDFISLPWDDVTGVNSLTSSPSPMSEGSIFNLAGQRMSKMQRGVNIVNGKKVLVK